jgi:hypothetical protein
MPRRADPVTQAWAAHCAAGGAGGSRGIGEVPKCRGDWRSRPAARSGLAWADQRHDAAGGPGFDRQGSDVLADDPDATDIDATDIDATDIDVGVA